MCKWNPVKAILMTASSDQSCFLWDCQEITKYYQQNFYSKNTDPRHKSRPTVAKSSLINKHENDICSVTCADWSSDGKLLATGNIKYLQQPNGTLCNKL